MANGICLKVYLTTRLENVLKVPKAAPATLPALIYGGYYCHHYHHCSCFLTLVWNRHSSLLTCTPRLSVPGRCRRKRTSLSLIKESVNLGIPNRRRKLITNQLTTKVKEETQQEVFESTQLNPLSV